MSGAAKGDNVVAYCHFNKHKGTLSAGMIKKHECTKKQCPFLEKYENKPYWIRKQVVNAIKKYKKNDSIGVILVDGHVFFKPNENNLYEFAKKIGKTGKVPEIVYRKEYIANEDL